MAGHNPYAPSAATLKPITGVSGLDGEVRVWREGKDVVMLHESSMGDRCIKCNAPAHEPSKLRTLYYHNPWLYLLLFSPIIYVIVAVIVRKKAVVDPGLCAPHKLARRNAILAAWALFAAAFMQAFLPLPAEMKPLLGLLLLVAALYLGFGRARLMNARFIDKFEVRLRGASNEYLESLPDHAARQSLLNS